MRKFTEISDEEITSIMDSEIEKYFEDRMSYLYQATLTKIMITCLIADEKVSVDEYKTLALYLDKRISNLFKDAELEGEKFVC